MRNGTRRPRAPSTRAGNSRHAGGTDIVTRRSSAVRSGIGQCREMLARQTKEHPGRSVALALGAGYLLGGGLFSRLTARVVGTGIRMGLRMAVIPFITQSIVALGEGMLTRGAGARQAEEEAEHDHDNDGASHSHSGTRSNQRHSDKKEI